MKIKRFSIILLIAIIALTTVGCDKEDSKYDNETTPLIFSTLQVDKVFNPFFATSGTDNTIVGMTQISMLGNDEKGKEVYGDDEAVVTKDLQIVTKGVEGQDQTSTYYFVIKNNVKFSNGSPLTIKDVLFNLYVYLDPVYTGSSTIYSTDIVGLQEYRTQKATEKEQENFNLQFEIIAESRIQALVDASNEIFDEHKNDSLTQEDFKGYLEEYTAISENYENVLKDYEKACELFEEELQTDYTNAADSFSDVVFSDQTGKLHKNLFTTDVETFLYNEGYITWSKKDAKLSSDLVNDVTTLKTWTKEEAIATIFEDKLPYAVEEVVQYWNTAVNLNNYIANEAIEEFFQNGSNIRYPNISGIKFANHKEPVEVNNVTYGVPEYNEDGSVKDGQYEVLSIEINDVDPKAIWNFAFNVAPMYYYSDEEHIKAFDFESNFGVERGSQTFMNEVVKNDEKIGVPVGAGPYAASKSSGGIENIKAGDFYSLGVIYYERNPYFLMGDPTINKIRFQVVAANQMLTTLYSGEVDFVEPNAKPETIEELNDKIKDGIGNKPIQTAGYGYIGINAGKVPDMAVRQAIMHSINTEECVSYYKTTATPIYRSMSMSSWAYPKGCTPYYPYIGGPVPEDLSVVNPAYAEYVMELGLKAGDKLSVTQQETFIKNLVEGAGYQLNGNGIYAKGTNTLAYTFTIAGEETDHPAWQAMYHAGEILNRNGFQILVKNDKDALTKLSQGALTVWAAAWGSTIDPDMYQVYHRDSKATSTLNWGYKQILQNNGNKYAEELKLVNELSELIDDARKTTDEKKRARIYSQALDIVMQLAVELPTYQRDDLFAYNTDKIDVSTLTPDSQCSPFKGLTSDLHKVSLNVER